MEIEIWADVVCPWCYIGKRRWEAALARFEHRAEVTVTWRSFELAPDAPTTTMEQTLVEMLAEKYGVSVAEAEAMNARVTSAAREEGLVFELDLARRANTFDAHRLVHLAAAHGRQDVAEERLFRAYFTEGVAIGDRAELIRLAIEIGLDGDAASEVLESDAYGDEVRADERLASELGISGVPFVVIDRRFGLSGAQPVEVFLEALDEAWEARQTA